MHGYDIPLVLHEVKGYARGGIHSSRLPFALVGSLQLARELEELFKRWQKIYPSGIFTKVPSAFPPGCTFGLEQSKKYFSLGVFLKLSFATDRSESTS